MVVFVCVSGRFFMKDGICAASSNLAFRFSFGWLVTARDCFPQLKLQEGKRAVVVLRNFVPFCC